MTFPIVNRPPRVRPGLRDPRSTGSSAAGASAASRTGLNDRRSTKG